MSTPLLTPALNGPSGAPLGGPPMGAGGSPANLAPPMAGARSAQPGRESANSNLGTFQV